MKIEKLILSQKNFKYAHITVTPKNSMIPCDTPDGFFHEGNCLFFIIKGLLTMLKMRQIGVWRSQNIKSGVDITYYTVNFFSVKLNLNTMLFKNFNSA